ncbi:MAG: type VI secretion system contractile sheath large subunit, partial [Pseudomonas aeruginosa]|nr:type VI secretion system contractile sheath large subunit [Pseudomonas aeruginosa]
MILALIIALPFMGALLPLLAERGGRTLCAASAGVAPLIGLILLLGQRGTVFAGQTLTASYSWLPEIGINLSLRLDGLGFLFALLILGIGLLVILYARYYLSEQEPMGRFFAFLLLFMGSMLGVVLAENLLLMMLFWELTSLSSFLLIGFWGSRSDARKGARMALTVTGGGGLALLAGVLLLGHIAGSFELTEVLAAGELIRAHALYPLVLILILLGVFTKSAQFPFHFWLPHAMAAPTPVSAYLHSATMVKAGVFLLARLYPALAGTEWFFYLVSLSGLVTLLLGAGMALFQHDLKGLLAYSTISHLGLITLLFGLDSPLSNVAAAAHAPFIAAASPRLFDMNSFTELAVPRDLTKIFESLELIKWRAFRESEDSRYVSLVLPNCRLRLPYGPETRPVEGMNYVEDVNGTDHSKYLWGNAAWVLAQRITEAFAKYGWCAAIRGAEGGGAVEGLPAHTFRTSSGDLSLKCPTEVAITDRREKELNDLGFISLCHKKNSDVAVFFGGQTTNKARLY